MKTPEHKDIDTMIKNADNDVLYGMCSIMELVIQTPSRLNEFAEKLKTEKYNRLERSRIKYHQQMQEFVRHGRNPI